MSNPCLDQKYSIHKHVKGINQSYAVWKTKIRSHILIFSFSITELNVNMALYSHVYAANEICSAEESEYWKKIVNYGLG